jgi:protein-L-isoaspartate(D-aspartate) O-methyltransferase
LTPIKKSCIFLILETHGNRFQIGSIEMAKGITFLLACALMFQGIPIIKGGYPGAKAWAEEKEEARYLERRRAMVRTQISDPPGYRKPIRDENVLAAMLAVPRHLFVKPNDLSKAYGDFPLPIGHGQTISQPYVVALMTDLLEVTPEQRVLEVGTGSGYQAAILSSLVKEVYTVEIIRALGQQASARMRRLDYNNVHLKIADGYYGWQEHAPFDRIIVTAAATLIPPPLLKQLRPGGKMCIPVGGQYRVQHLTMVEKSEAGRITMKKILPVRFVPFIRAGE